MNAMKRGVIAATVVILALCLLGCSIKSSETYCGIVKSATYLPGGWNRNEGWNIDFEDGMIMFVIGGGGKIQKGHELCIEKSRGYWYFKRRMK